MEIRLFATLQAVSQPKVKHYLGLPQALTEGSDERVLLPVARVLILEETVEGFFIFRHMIDGGFIGDTWHQTLEDARKQAEYEYGDALGEWREIPGDVEDPVAFALQFGA